MLLRHLLDRLMLEQTGRALRLGHVELEEALGPKRTVGGDGDAVRLAQLHQPVLHQIRMVLDLQRLRHRLRVPQQVQHQGAVVVADADAAGQARGGERLHRVPRRLEARGCGRHAALGVVPAGWVAGRRVDVLEGDGEVHDVEVEVVDAPVGELLLADGLDPLGVVEGVPELGDEEEVGALHEAVFDGAGDALAGFDFVAVVWGMEMSECVHGWGGGMRKTNRRRRRRVGNPI